jgi:hypothetical protein
LRKGLDFREKEKSNPKKAAPRQAPFSEEEVADSSGRQRLATHAKENSVSTRPRLGAAVLGVLGVLLGGPARADLLIDVPFPTPSAPTYRGAAVLGNAGDVWNAFKNGKAFPAAADGFPVDWQTMIDLADPWLGLLAQLLVFTFFCLWVRWRRRQPRLRFARLRIGPRGNVAWHALNAVKGVGSWPGSHALHSVQGVPPANELATAGCMTMRCAQRGPR